MSREKRINEIAPNVWQITVGEGEFQGVYAPNVWFVKGNSRAVFIDTAYGKDDETQAHLDFWEEQGKPEVAGVILTHRHGDHIGGAARLSEATGAPITTSVVERDPIEQDLKGAKVGKTVNDSETLDLGGVTLEFIHTPGHTMGSLCMLLREHGVLFTGDMILGTGTTVISNDHGDMAAYVDSMRKMLGYDARVIAPGHGPIINTPQDKIRELIDHRIARENQILELLGQGNGTIDDLLNSIYSGNIHPKLHDTARNQIHSHLIKLEREGKVREEGDGYVVA